MTIPGNELSEREQEILCLVATGASNKEIAQRLTISTNTVKVHLRNIFAKIGVSSRTEAAMYAVNSGLVEKSPIIVGEGILAGNDSISSDDEPVHANKAGFEISKWVVISGLSLLLVIIITIGYLIIRYNQRQVASNAKVDLEWKQLAPMPTERHNLAAVAYDGYIYAIAGQSAKGLTGAAERYDLKSDRWSSVADKPTPVYEAEAAVVGGKLYVPGGRMQDGRVTDILEIFDPGNDTWVQGEKLPHVVSAYALVSFEGKLYLFGGWDGSRYLSSVFIYDPVNDHWSEGFPMPTPRAYLSAAVSGRRIFVIGGKNDQGSLNVNEVYAPDLALPTNNSWRTGQPLPIESNEWKLVSLADLIYACGVIQSEATQNYGIFAYIGQKDAWQLISSQPTQPAREGSLVGYGTNIYTIGGLRTGSPVGDNWTQQVIFLVAIPLISR
jgi:DNA-binding CsgD family transcriptional regulator